MRMAARQSDRRQPALKSYAQKKQGFCFVVLNVCGLAAPAVVVKSELSVRIASSAMNPSLLVYGRARHAHNRLVFLVVSPGCSSRGVTLGIGIPFALLSSVRGNARLERPQ
jgi:hypothetical protein